MPDNEFDTGPVTELATESVTKKVSPAQESIAPSNIKKVHVGETEFNILTIDSPDKWLKAADLKFEQVIEFSKNKRVKMNFNGISYAQWQYIMSSFKVLDDTEANKTVNDRALLCRKVYLFEQATGKNIQGANIEEKVDHIINTMPLRFLEQLHALINNIACGVSDGPLVGAYRKELEKSQAIVQDFTDFDSLSSSSDYEFELCLQRPFEGSIVLFPIKAISHQAKEAIEKECVRPTPPLSPRKDPRTGNVDFSSSEPDVHNPWYLARLRACAEKRIVSYLDECLPFRIPGNTHQEKSDWLSKKLVGDVIKLHRFIENNIISYENSYGFF